MAASAVPLKTRRRTWSAATRTSYQPKRVAAQTNVTRRPRAFLPARHHLRRPRTRMERTLMSASRRSAPRGLNTTYSTPDRPRDCYRCAIFYENLDTMHRWTLAGLAFGLVLFVFGFAALGMGHGSFLPMAIYGAPFSAVPLAGMLVVPFWWTALGWAIASQRGKLALGMLALNLAGAGAFVLLGTPMENGEDQWRYFEQTKRILPFCLWGGFASYAAMLLLMLKASLRQIVSPPVAS